jgi:hypothetical protein
MRVSNVGTVHSEADAAGRQTSAQSATFILPPLPLQGCLYAARQEASFRPRYHFKAVYMQPAKKPRFYGAFCVWGRDLQCID